jgi:ACS family glucarate transporter-like MFS transporter
MDLAARPSRVRWYILALLTGFSLVSYIERINLSVASRFIRDEFGLTDIQLGWTFSAFLVAYTAAQIPSGWLADRFGSRNILTIAALLWFTITVTMGVYVGWVASSASQVLISLIALRVMLGVAEAPTFPAGSSAIARWFPSRERGKASAIVQAASYGGEALTLVVLAAVVAASGWRTAIFLSAAPALFLAIAWWRFGRSRPEDHPGVNSHELALIRSDPGPAAARPTGRAVDAVLRRDVTLLSASYFCQGYVIYLFFFWFYIYLVDVRGFSIAAGGVVGALPTVAAAVCAFIGGTVSDRAAKRWGSLSGRRMVIVASALVGGALLLCGAVADHAAIAIACFVGAIGTRGLVESAYWSTIIDLSGPHAGTAGGAMNMMSNLGGAVSTALAPILVAQFGWATALSVAAFVTMISGVMLLAMPNPRPPHRP